MIGNRKIIVLVWATFLLIPIRPQAQDYQLHAVSDLVRVFGDGYNMIGV
jgi:hypothetical protein